MAEIPQDVRALAAGIADDIERNGGFRKNRDQVIWSWQHPNAPCCIVRSPSFSMSLPEMNIALRTALSAPSLVEWYDDTPVFEVVATLRKIAAGEQP
jgi:hypothetical protein